MPPPRYIKRKKDGTLPPLANTRDADTSDANTSDGDISQVYTLIYISTPSFTCLHPHLHLPISVCGFLWVYFHVCISVGAFLVCNRQ